MSTWPLSRRQFVSAGMAAAVLAGVREQWSAAADSPDGPLQLYWGDLHNHNAVGYAKGSLERSIDLAQEHLDFFAFTGHASWHDLPVMPEDRHMKWVNGFEVHSRHWPKTRQMLREANNENFVALQGYEWHSSRFGDYCVIFPDDQPELYLPDHVDKLLDFAADRQALAITHHVGYKQGWRGANWDVFRGGTVSPVVEIFSEHGCCETERAPLPMIRHSNGGRDASQMIVRQLQRGMRFGFVASSDDHLGYPGAYGEGVLGVWARDLSAASLFEAIRARRTYAATGDRIALEMSINSQPMGSELPATSDRQIDVRVEGQDAIRMIELVRNGRVIKRHFPEDHVSGPPELPGRVKCRLQFGWGPWAALGLGRVCDWDFDLHVDGGQFRRAWGCFQAAPFDEQLRDRLRLLSPTHLHLASNTTRVECYGEDPTKSLVLELDAQRDARLTLHLHKPTEQTYVIPLSSLRDDNLVEFTGGFTAESFILGPLVGTDHYTAKLRWQDRNPSPEGADWYYLRVTQHNGHMAWSSPIWIG